MSGRRGGKRPPPGRGGGGKSQKRRPTRASAAGTSRESSLPAVPAPSELLRDCDAPLANAPLFCFPVSLSADAYLAAREQPKVCNLQLTVAVVSAEELLSFPAKLPAADGYVLSKLISGRLQSEDPPPTAEGVTQLQLCIGVKQQVLDAVVRAVYDKSLSIDPSNAESLLLVAEHLQLEWLIKSVADYLKQHVLVKHPLALCQLSQRVPALGLYRAAIDRMRLRLEPKEMVVLLQLEPADRARVLKAVSERATPPQCLEFFSLLQCGPEEGRPTEAELHAVIGRHPELAMPLLQPRRQKPLEADECEAVWQRHYSLHNQVAVSVPALVWALPLKQLRQVDGTLVFSMLLRIQDGRSFELVAKRRASVDGGGERMGLFARPHGGSVWRKGDFVSLTTIKSAPNILSSETYYVIDDKVGSPRGIGDHELIDKWTTTRMLMIASGAYLPVKLQVHPSKN